MDMGAGVETFAYSIGFVIKGANKAKLSPS